MTQTPTILYQDNHLLAVSKPAGMLVQGDRTGDASLIDWAKAYIKTTYNKPGDVFVGLPHRLDRPVSGLVLLCKTSKSLSRVNQLFAKRQITKIYRAVVTGHPATQATEWTHYLIKNKQTNSVTAHKHPQQGTQQATTRGSLLHSHKGLHLMAIEPLTGRPHQIRVQLSQAGLPIVGDIKYGGHPHTNPKAIGLHAYALCFVHPVQKTPITITAPLPQTPLWLPFANVQH